MVPYGIKIGDAVIDREFANKIAEKAIDTILSELPEEAQTFDVAKYIIENAKVQLGFRRINHKE